MRMPVPKAIRDAPELNLGLEFVYHAFWELSSTRPIGWGPGVIAWRSIRDYAEFHDIPREDMEDFAFLIRAMDHAFLTYHSEQSDKARNQTS